MDKEEARRLAQERVQELRPISYEQLCALAPETTERVGTSGAVYQVESRIFWDDREGDAVRVVVAVDDGGWRAMAPLTEDFIKAPDGSFVGEWS